MPLKNPAQTFIEHMLQYTVRLLRDAGTIDEASGLASGIIVERPRGLRLLTAGHIFRKPGTWTLETQVVVGERTVHIILANVQRLCSVDLPTRTPADIDLAWSTIDIARLSALKRDDPALKRKAIILPKYTGPLNELPLSSGYYGFAAWNRVEFHSKRRVLFAEPSFEIGMTYKGQHEKDGLYEFELARSHQGHDYYYGASGAPIANEEGKIVSLLLSGDPARNILWGVPLARYASILDVDD